MVEAIRITPLTFSSRGIALSGDVTWPGGPGPHAGVVFLHGTGWPTREFFRAHCAAFAGAGVAAFAFDRRGHGASGGVPVMELATLAADAAAACTALRAQPGIDPARVGLLGYSNGAWVATKAAARDPALGFLILTGAAAVTQADAEVYRRTRELRDRGICEATLAAVERTWRILFEAMGTGRWEDTWDGELAAASAASAADERLQALPLTPFLRDHPEFDPVPRFESPLLTAPRRLAGTLPDMAYDPVSDLAAVRCPVLVVLAGDDENVPVAASLERFRAASEARGGEPFLIEVVAGANHAFSRRPDASPGPLAGDAFLPGYLEGMARWAASRTRG